MTNMLNPISELLLLVSESGGWLEPNAAAVPFEVPSSLWLLAPDALTRTPWDSVIPFSAVLIAAVLIALGLILRRNRLRRRIAKQAEDEVEAGAPLPDVPPESAAFPEERAPSPVSPAGARGQTPGFIPAPDQDAGRQDAGQSAVTADAAPLPEVGALSDYQLDREAQLDKEVQQRAEPARVPPGAAGQPRVAGEAVTVEVPALFGEPTKVPQVPERTQEAVAREQEAVPVTQTVKKAPEIAAEVPSEVSPPVVRSDDPQHDVPAVASVGRSDDESSAQSSPTEGAQSSPTEGAQSSQPVVLLLEDSATMRRIVEIVLAGEPYQLISLDNSEEALEHAKENHPAVIIVDTILGADGGSAAQSGYHFCEAIRREKGLEQTPILLLHGNSEPVDASQVEKVQATDHLKKPFASNEIISKISDMIAA